MLKASASSTSPSKPHKLKKYIYIFVAIAVVCGLVLFSQRKHYSTWDVSTADPNGHEPYDMAVFDSLLYRSLPNGYEVKHWDVAEAYTDIYTNKYKEIIKPLHLTDSLNPKSQNVLIVQRTELYSENDYTINALRDALDYADQGGNVLLVREQLGYGDSFLNRLTGQIGETMDYDEYSYFPKYDVKQLSKIDDYVLQAKTSEGRLNIHHRFAPSYFIKDDYDQEDNIADVFLKKMSLSYESYIKSSKPYNRIYGLVFRNKRSGGNVYLCTLGLYFSNLGVTIPDGDKVIAYNMGKIDNKPVVRVDYEKLVPNGSSLNSESGKMLSVLSKNKALSFAWTLVLLLAVLLLVCGIYRKHPAKRDAHLIYVDETDPVAVREAKFRQSPLLHFIFQYSWLYKGKQNYTELFLINYRQFARYVNRKSGIELSSADDNKLKTATNALAMRTGLGHEEIWRDLINMRLNKMNADNGTIISPKEYIQSQQIIEKYL